MAAAAAPQVLTVRELNTIDTLVDTIVNLLNGGSPNTQVSQNLGTRIKAMLRTKNIQGLISDGTIVKFQQSLDDLVAADDGVKVFAQKYPNVRFSGLLDELVRIQVLALVENVILPAAPTDCDGPIRELVEIFTNKLKAVNAINEGKLNDMPALPVEGKENGAGAGDGDGARAEAGAGAGAGQPSSNKYFKMFGGSYEQKYMKYKAKYLELKQSLRSRRF